MDFIRIHSHSRIGWRRTVRALSFKETLPALFCQDLRWLATKGNVGDLPVLMPKAFDRRKSTATQRLAQETGFQTRPVAGVEHTTKCAEKSGLSWLQRVDLSVVSALIEDIRGVGTRQTIFSRVV
jgi:hypothetical protein